METTRYTTEEGNYGYDMEQHNISTAEELFDALGKDNQKGGNGKGGYSM